MLPEARLLKVGARSVIDEGKLVIGTGGGTRTRHVFSSGLDLGLPTGVLAGLSIADALGNVHILGTLPASRGGVAIPPAIFGHLLPFFFKVHLALFSTAIRRMAYGNNRPPSDGCGQLSDYGEFWL